MPNLSEDYRIAKSVGGALEFSDWECLSLTGKDIADYLHRMSTGDIKKIPHPAVGPVSFLNAKGGLLAFGFLIRLSPSEFRYWVPPGSSERTFQHLETFHFGESFDIQKMAQERALLAAWLPSEQWIKSLSLQEISPMLIRSSEFPNSIAWRDGRLNWLVWIDVKMEDRHTILSLAKEKLSRATFDYERSLGGVGFPGVEIPWETLALEAGIESSISQNKGCYPGQEVVERILSYGQVNRKLVALKSKDAFSKMTLNHEGKAIGEVLSHLSPPSPELPHAGLGIVRKEFFGKRLETIEVGVPA